MYDRIPHVECDHVGTCGVRTHALGGQIFQAGKEGRPPISGPGFEIRKRIDVDGVAANIQCLDDMLARPDSHMPYMAQAKEIEIASDDVGWAGRIRADQQWDRRRASPLRFYRRCQHQTAERSVLAKREACAAFIGVLTRFAVRWNEARQQTSTSTIAARKAPGVAAISALGGRKFRTCE